MTERSRDFELLQRFVREGEQAAFAEVVQRHLGLVFGTVWRKVSDEGAAQEISQNVFCALTRKAWQFAPDDSLPAWLHKTALLEAKSWLRGELRRRRREETAAELGTTMKTPDDQPALRTLMPLLDEALLSLRETDRTALLLRYCENHSLREVGAAFGVSDDTAQKRVQSALEKLSRHFQQRGYRTASVAVTAAVLKTSSAQASALTASMVVKAALQSAPPTMVGLKVLLARAAVFTKGQTVTICLIVALVPTVWQLQRLHHMSAENTSLKRRIEANQIEQQKSNAEVKRLTAEANRLESRRAGFTNTLGDQREIAQKWAALKNKSRALLTDDHYRWPDDLPFVRVPKSALAVVQIAGGTDTAAKMEMKIKNFLDLSSTEQQSVDQIFANYFTEIEQLVAVNLHETNVTRNLSHDDGAKAAVLDPIGQKIKIAVEQLWSDVSNLLGEENWAMLNLNQKDLIYYEQRRLLGYTNSGWNQRQLFVFHVSDKSGGVTVNCLTSYEDGSGPFSEVLHMTPRDNFQGPSIFVDYVRKYLNTQPAQTITK